LVNIINQVDIPPAEVVSEFIKLDRADAAKVVDMLKEVFDKGQSNGGPGAPGGGRNIRPVPGAPPVPQPVGQFEGGDLSSLTALSEDSVIVGKIKLSADVRTNRIHVITRPVNMPFVKRLISEFDANVEFAKPVTRPLRYISAADVLPVIVQALTEPGAEGGAGAEATGANPNNNPQQQNRRNPSNTASTNSDFGTNGTNNEGGGQNFSEELSTQPVDTTPKAVTIGNSKIIADQRANTIIILGNREVVVKVQKILDEMDVSAPQVALSTVIGELTLGNTEEFGIDWFLRQANRKAATSDNIGLNKIGGPGLPGATPGAGIFTPGAIGNFTQLANAATSGANVYLAAGNTLSTIVKALDSTGRFKTISRPTIFTSNNKKAIIASGQEIPVPVSTISGAGTVVNGLAQQSNIQFKKVALQLEVVPLINSEKEVSLDILQKLDSLTGDSTTVDGNAIPTIATRYIKTTVTAPNCSTIVLGGLILDNKRVNKDGIPILDRLPLIGALFRNTSNIKSRQELIVLMRPEVTLTKTDIHRLRQKTEEKTHFGPEIDQDDCPDCPPRSDSKELTPPDLPDLPADK
jgi:general secretion pathway protein D